MQKIITKKFNIKLYEANITLIIGDSDLNIQKHLDKQKINVDISNTQGCVFENHTENSFNYYIIFIEKNINHNLISHEVYHLAYSIMNTLGIHHEETTAWVIGHITEILYAFFNKQKLIIK